MAKLGDLVVDLRANTAQFNRSIKRSQTRVRRMGTEMRALSAALLGGAGIVGVVYALRSTVRAGSEFEASITQIITLVGVARERVMGWRDSILALGPAVGRGPGELARAMFVITSAGERGANALKILEAAGKASAIGLGDTATIARSVTAAMQAYRRTGLTAARATDVLVATVREGNLEAASLAGSLGRVLGVASEFGVSFEQVGGFIATFTRLGVSAQEAVTALRSTILLIAKPGKEAREALAGLGLTIEDVRRNIAEKGLAQALVDLVGVLQQDQEALAAVFPNLRSFAGVLATASAQSEQFVAINESVANSLGILDKGFETVQQDAKFAFQQLGASWERLQIVIADKALPFIKQLTRALSAVTSLLAAESPKMAEAFQLLGQITAKGFIAAFLKTMETLPILLSTIVSTAVAATIATMVEQLKALPGMPDALADFLGDFATGFALPAVKGLELVNGALGKMAGGLGIADSAFRLLNTDLAKLIALAGGAPLEETEEDARKFGDAAKFLNQQLPTLIGKFREMARLQTPELLKDIPLDVENQMGRWLDKLEEDIETFEDTVKDIGRSAGRGLIRGLVNGIESARDLLSRTLAFIAEELIMAGFDKLLKMQSPSKEMFDRGVNTMRGYVMGMQRAAQHANLTAPVMNMTPQPRMGSFAMAGGPGGMNVTQNVIFAPRLMDMRGVDQWWQENKWNAALVVSQAARDVGGFRNLAGAG